LDRDDRLGRELRELQRHRPTVVTAPLRGEAGLGERLKLAVAAELFVEPQQPGSGDAELWPQLQRAHQVANRSVLVVGVAADDRGAVQQQRARTRSGQRRDVLLEQ